MVVFYDKIISNSEANYIVIDDIVVNKKELSDEINDSEKDFVVVGKKKIEVIRKTKKSKTKNYIVLDDKEYCLDHIQSTYNLEKDFYTYATENKILKKNPRINHARKEKDGSAYVLNDYEFKLGEGVFSIIGDNFRECDNKFITSLNKSNGKFQIYRIVYDQKANPENYKSLSLIKEEGYGWFVELFDNNIVGSRLIIDINEEEKIFTLDVLM